LKFTPRIIVVRLPDNIGFLVVSPTISKISSIFILFNYLHMKGFLSIIMAILILLSACSKKQQIPSELPNDGPVSKQEISSVSPPTYQQVVDAYDVVTKKDPSIINNEQALGRAIFNYIKAQPVTIASTPSIKVNSNAVGRLFNIVDHLTKEEWDFLFSHNPVHTVKAYLTITPSLNAAQTTYSCDADVGFEDSKADALRHAFWNILIAKEINSDFAQEMATVHESASSSGRAKEMDLHNNLVGRKLFEQFPNATTDQFLALLLSKTFVFLNDGDKIPNNVSDLVYFKGKRLFDGTMTGSMTNPDTKGGPWKAVLNFNQCGFTIRGQVLTSRGNEVDNRRFSGVIETSGMLTLTLAEPFAFESASGYTPCSNVVIKLSGGEKKLSGNWTSSNCRLGGVLTVSR